MENHTQNSSLSPWHYFSTEYLKHDSAWTSALIIAYSTIFLLGCLGNVVVILVISRNPHMKTVTNLFILNLAVADLFVVFFCVPGTLVANIYTPWVFGSIVCKVMSYSQGVSVCASVYSLVAISVDRCRALYRPIGQTHGFSKLHAKLIIFLIWGIGLVITLPGLMSFDVVYSKETEDFGYPYCQEVWEDVVYGNVYFVAVHLVLCFVLPLLIICVLNLIIWWNMRKFQRVSLEQELPLRYNITGISRLLCVISITFVICWIPLYVLMTKIKLFSSSTQPGSVVEVLIPLAQLLGSTNSCANPILYAFHSKKFRDCIATSLRRQGSR